tara:strand:+ start:176 stop:496 length:321 start_codon:yes stop_codon:yes gene_type:complete
MLTLVLLFQWTLPIIDKKKNFHINFSDITFEKCNDPNHSHPPLSQRDTPNDIEKLANFDICNPFIINEFQNYFYFTVKIVFEKPEGFPELLFKHFSPARSPPFFEV